MNSVDACAICLGNFQFGENCVKTKCCHIFHAQCLEPWLNEKPKCPLCRANVARIFESDKKAQALKDAISTGKLFLKIAFFVNLLVLRYFLLGVLPMTFPFFIKFAVASVAVALIIGAARGINTYLSFNSGAVRFTYSNASASA